MIASVGNFAKSAMPAISAAGTLLSARQKLAGGSEDAAIADSVASQLDARANETRAMGSIQSQRLKVANERLRSRQRAILAGSGFKMDDPTGTALQDAVTKQGTIQELLATAQAEQEARNDNLRAKLVRKQGAQARQASYLVAGETLVNGFSSWRDRFGTAPANDGGSTDTPQVWDEGGLDNPPPWMAAGY
jgi:hypothetical protein